MLVLASTSPRRAMLLKEWGFEFKIVNAPVSEELSSDILPELAVQELAERKAQAGLRLWLESGGAKGDIILGADTVVALDGQILGKPADAEEAREMLRSLSGKLHSVFTGVALVNGTGLSETAAVRTDVHFRELSPEEIEIYIATGEPFDKAGAYGIQGEASKFVEYVDGSLTNVIGLPMEHVSERLRAWGIEHKNYRSTRGEQ